MVRARVMEIHRSQAGRNPGSGQGGNFVAAARISLAL
jgi:hypothetical protein